jgi:signal transduction histidine kinase
MKDRSVKALLFVAILVMTALPLTAAFYFLEYTLETSLNLGFNREIVTVLENELTNLKTLRKLDPENQERYRRQFEEASSLEHVYSNPDLVKGSIRQSLRTYFGLGLVAAVALSVLLAALLSRRIAASYSVAFRELSAQRERVRYLEEMSSWQELAKVLAHEIKNPLTPIEVLVTSLSRSYLNKNREEFRELLDRTEAMIGEELGHLKNTVNRFSEFARLPKVVLADEDLATILRQHAKAIGANVEQARIDLRIAPDAEGVRAKLDATLFRQVLMNLVRNGVEANPRRSVAVEVALTATADHLRIAVSNDGVPVPAALVSRMFDPYISTKTGKENMGLGLAIVRKIVLEHGGEIRYHEVAGRPTFTIEMMRTTP